MRLAPLLLALFVASPALAQTPGQTTIPDAALQAASQLREQALADDTAWKVTESLTWAPHANYRRNTRRLRHSTRAGNS